MKFEDDRIGPGIPELAKRLRETSSINSDNLCPPHKVFLHSQNLTGCVLCERNKEIEDLKTQLTASKEREGILRGVLVEVKETSESVLQSTYRTQFNKYFLRVIRITTDALEKAEEVK